MFDRLSRLLTLRAAPGWLALVVGLADWISRLQLVQQVGPTLWTFVKGPAGIPLLLLAGFLWIFVSSFVIPAKPKTVIDWSGEIQKLNVEVANRDRELHNWGPDFVTRKHLWQARRELPTFTVDFVDDFARLLANADKAPTTQLRIQHQEHDDRRGSVGLPGTTSSVILPTTEAAQLARKLQEMIDGVQKRAIEEIRQKQSTSNTGDYQP